MPRNTDIWGKISALRRDGVGMVVVTVTACRGSVPGSLGAKAIITREGLVEGTLGGGKVEARVIEEALEMLGGSQRCTTKKWNLQQDVGMTCGGEMEFSFELVDAGKRWHIVIFGAGHVTQALVPVLSAMECSIDVIEEREEWLEQLPVRENVLKHLVTSFPEGSRFVTGKSMVLSITKGHASDRPVLEEILGKYPDIPFLGVIGSRSKRAVLFRELRENGISEDLLEKVVCPLGLPLGGNDPAEIAVSIAAQLLQQRGAADELEA
ncbi:XdhC family protein [Luteolibacter sp. AS25]|uniref:XdhC family protein n=1 Tax=Luteolibacter sp. AS25 TaxID=3135776 RepID=UPI00398A5B28